MKKYINPRLPLGRPEKRTEIPVRIRPEDRNYYSWGDYKRIAINFKKTEFKNDRQYIVKKHG